MANYSSFLSLISGADRTVNLSLSGNVLELGGAGLQMDGSTSGHVSISASATTTSYSMIWPSAQAASSGYVLTNDGTGVLSWSAAAATGANTALSNLSAVAINTSLLPGTDNTINLGSASFRWSNVYALNQLLYGSSSGSITQSASATTTSYAITWPAAQGAAGTGLFNNGSGVLSWSLISNANISPTAAIDYGKLNLSGSIVNADVAGGANIDYAKLNLAASVQASDMNSGAATSGQVLTANGTGGATYASPATSGTVTSVSVTSANGLAGTVATATTTPAITLSTTITGILQGNGTAISAATTTGSGAVVLATSPTLVTPALGTPSALVGTNITGTAAGLTAGTVTTNANLTGDVTSVGNATSLVATTNSTITTLSALSLPGSQVTGNISGNSANVTGTVLVPNGGTGLTTLTPYAVLAGGTTSTGNVQQVSGLGTSGQVLTSNGASALPTWQNIPGSGTVTTVSVVSTNGFAGTVANPTSTPAITIETTLNTPVLAGNGTALIAATTTGTGSTVVLSASPTFTGTVTTAAISATSGSFSSAINMNSTQINNLANGTASGDAVNLGQLQAAISGLYWQGPAQAYADSNVPLTGAATLTIDGYAVQNGDLVILGNQTTASQNGEYTASGIGTAYVLTANGLPTAAGDAWLILNGTVYSDSAFVANAAVPAATFTQFAGPTAYMFSAPLLLTGRTVSITQATTSTNGYLSSTDWNTFNNKQPAGSYITALTGDGTASGPGSSAFTLATVNSNVGSFGSASSVPSFNVNAKGLITSASQTAVVAPAGTLSGSTLNASVVTSSLTTVGTIGTGVWNGTAIGPTFGGTGQTSYTTGDTLYASATNTLSKLGIGTTGQVLTVVAGVPAWASASTGTVTSVAVSVPSSSIFGVTGSPITSSGTIGITTTGTSGGIPYFSSTSQIASSALLAANTLVIGGGAGTAPSSISAGTGTVNQVLHGNASGQPTWSAVAAGDLGTVTDGVTTNQSGAGSTIQVISSPSSSTMLVAGQTFAANTSYAVRWGINSLSETTDRVYAADQDTTTTDKFWVIGIAFSAAGVSAGALIAVTMLGSYTLGSGDTAFTTGSVGTPVWLTSAGAFSTTAPSASLQADFKVGMVQSTTQLWIDRQMMGVN